VASPLRPHPRPARSAAVQRLATPAPTKIHDGKLDANGKGVKLGASTVGTKVHTTSLPALRRHLYGTGA